MCAIVFTEGTDYQKKLDELKPIIERMEQDPISFVFIKSEEEPYIYQTIFGSNKAVLFKPKRNKYMPLPIGSVDDLQSAISDALGGGGTWSKSSELLFGEKATHDPADL